MRQWDAEVPGMMGEPAIRNIAHLEDRAVPAHLHVMTQARLRSAGLALLWTLVP